jgi:hypothetical protein
MDNDELVANAIAAENVRRYLDGVIDKPLPGTLAWRVHVAVTVGFDAQ